MFVDGGLASLDVVDALLVVVVPNSLPHPDRFQGASASPSSSMQIDERNAGGGRWAVGRPRPDQTRPDLPYPQGCIG